MVLIANSEADLQAMLNSMHNWCHKWRLNVNKDKSNIVHFLPKRKQKTTVKFMFGAHEISIVDKYKYLGVYFDENLTYDHCIKTLSESAGRALGGIIGKFKTFKDIGYNTFGVIPILDYGVGIWGNHNNKCTNLVLNKAITYYLGVHRFAPNT